MARLVSGSGKQSTAEGSSVPQAEIEQAQEMINVASEVSRKTDAEEANDFRAALRFARVAVDWCAQ
jgi:CHAD domain-containing protein